MNIEECNQAKWNFLPTGGGRSLLENFGKENNERKK